MGDHADDAIDRALNDIIHYDNFRDADEFTKFDEGLLDEMGFEYMPDLRIPRDPFNWKR
jgi:hypothetical protein